MKRPLSKFYCWRLVAKPLKRWTSVFANGYIPKTSARTFHALALHIIQQGSKKVPIVSKLENDTAARHELFIAEWRKQCSEKKAQAKGWRQWLTEEMQWSVPEGNFWDDEKLQRRLASRLDRWVSLMRMHGGAQAEMIASAPEEIRDLSVNVSS